MPTLHTLALANGRIRNLVVSKKTYKSRRENMFIEIQDRLTQKPIGMTFKICNK